MASQCLIWHLPWGTWCQGGPSCAVSTGLVSLCLWAWLAQVIPWEDPLWGELMEFQNLLRSDLNLIAVSSLWCCPAQAHSWGWLVIFLWDTFLKPILPASELSVGPCGQRMGFGVRQTQNLLFLIREKEASVSKRPVGRQDLCEGPRRVRTSKWNSQGFRVPWLTLTSMTLSGVFTTSSVAAGIISVSSFSQTCQDPTSHRPTHVTEPPTHYHVLSYLVSHMQLKLWSSRWWDYNLNMFSHFWNDYDIIHLVRLV